MPWIIEDGYSAISFWHETNEGLESLCSAFENVEERATNQNA